MSWPLARKWLGLLLTLVLVTSACSASAPIDDELATATVSAPEPTAGTAVTESADGSPDEEQEPCDMTTSDVDMWAGLDSPALDFARQRTNLLLDSNPESCQPFVQVDATIDAAALGAVAVRSVVHADPYVRYDLFVFESRQVADELGARDVARNAVTGVVPADSAVDVFRVGDSLFVAESYTDDGSGRPPREVRGILDYYGQLISGLE